MRLATFILAAAAVVPAFPQSPAAGNCGLSTGGKFQTVIGAPYSAHHTTEEVQTLADGTHQIQKGGAEIAVWRDSSGRVRTEVHNPSGRGGCEAFSALIQDPVAGYTYVLNSRDQVVHRAPLVAAPALTAAEVVAEPGTEANESLGAQTMLGVNVVGTKTTGTRIAETWTAPALAVVVYQKVSRPEAGTESIGRLKDLSTAEPDPALFHPPSGYKVMDESPDLNGGMSLRATPPSSPGAASDCSYDFNFPSLPLGMQPVTGAPYSARESVIRTTGSAGAREESRPAWRDSAGRMRTQAEGSCGAFIAQISDPVGGFFYELDLVHHIAHRLPLKPQPAIAAADVAPDTSAGAESLGARTIAGVAAVGTRETTGSAVHESWYAPNLGLTVSSRDENRNGTVSRTLEDLSIVEPDPALFKVPEGYTVVDETGPFQFTIPNPRTPAAAPR